MKKTRRAMGWSLALMFAAGFIVAAPAQATGTAPCPLPDDPVVLLDLIWPLVDVNGDGGISLTEIQVLYPLEGSYFNIVDSNHDGLVVRSELIVFLPLLQSFMPDGLLGMVDTNGDALIQYSEVSGYVTQAQFDQVDINGNGVIDCGDISDVPPGEGEGEGESEGEPEGEPEGELPPVEGEVELPCPLPDDTLALLEFVMPAVDANGDGGLSQAELRAIVPDIDDYLYPYDLDTAYQLADANHDGAISVAEVSPFLPLLGDISVMEYADLNADGVISFDEVSEYATQEQFDLLDANANGVLDCEDMGSISPGEGEGEGESEGEGEGEGDLPCPLPRYDITALASVVWPAIDTDGNGGITLEELETVVAPFEDQLPSGITGEFVFSVIDANHDGYFTIDEVEIVVAMIQTFMKDASLLPIDYLEGIDLNGDSLIQYSEVSDYVTPAQFAVMDRNANGVLDCEDVVPIEPPPAEGEGEGEGEGELPCPLPRNDITALATIVWPAIDTDGNGQITLAELDAAVGPFEDQLPFGFTVEAIFDDLDTNQDGYITPDEIEIDISGIMTLAKDASVLPIDLLAWIDLNGDSLIQYAEVSAYVTPAQFAAMDRNANGVLDCADIVPIDTPPAEGEGEGELPCPLPADSSLLLDLLWPMVDTDGDGNISFAEAAVIYPDLSASEFGLLDFNGDGVVSRDEIFAILPVLPVIGVLDYIDLNGNGVIEYAEVSDYLTAEQFASLDENGNGVLDCEDVFGTPPETEEGEGETSPDPGILEFLMEAFSAMDVNSDGYLTLSEFQMFFPAPGLFRHIDYNGDGRITRDEIQILLDGAASGGWDAESDLRLIQQVEGNCTYTPGETLTVIDVIEKRGDATISALGFQATLPDGWTLAQVVQAAGAETAPAEGDSGVLEFAWLTIPDFPARIVYQVNVPSDAVGAYIIQGEALYRTVDSTELTTGVVLTAVGEGLGAAWTHSADYDHDWSISLSEILRVIQIFNLDGYQCGGDTEDGFAPRQGETSCSPHDADYITQDWRIDLSELLRVIQLFNAPANVYHVLEGSEDGFAPGVYSLS